MSASEYHAFRQGIIKWINDGKGSVTPAMVGEYLAQHASLFPYAPLAAEIEILETSPDWEKALEAISKAYARGF